MPLKELQQVEVLRGRYAGYKGFIKDKHQHMPDYFWVKLANEMPWPVPGGSDFKHHELKVLAASQLQQI